MNEQQFLELSDRERDWFIAEKVFGYELIKRGHLYTYKEPHDYGGIGFVEKTIPDYQSWEGMGKGIEHANENGFSVNIWVHENESRAGIVNLENGDTWYTPCNEKSIMLNFFVVYCKALGVLE